MLLRASRASFAGLRVTESGSVAGSGAQPLLDNIIMIIIINIIIISLILIISLIIVISLITIIIIIIIIIFIVIIIIL